MDEDIKYFVYLFFVLIYIISRAFKKKKPKAPQVPQGESTEAPDSKVTFEDLLREFGADIPKEEEIIDQPKPEPVQTIPGPSYIPDDEYSREIFNRSVEAATYEEKAQASPAFKDQGLKFERDDKYKITEETHPLAQKLKNPETLVDAIIYSEILNRKYD